MADLPSVLRDHVASLSDPHRGRPPALAPGIGDRHPPSPSPARPFLAQPPGAFPSPADRERAGARSRRSPARDRLPAPRYLLRPGHQLRLPRLRERLLRGHGRRYQSRLGAARPGAVAHRLSDAELPGRPSPAGVRRGPRLHRVHRLPPAPPRRWAGRIFPCCGATWPAGSSAWTASGSSAIKPGGRSTISWEACRRIRRGGRPSSPTRSAAPERRRSWPGRCCRACAS